MFEVKILSVPFKKVYCHLLSVSHCVVLVGDHDFFQYRTNATLVLNFETLCISSRLRRIQYRL